MGDNSCIGRHNEKEAGMPGKRDRRKHAASTYCERESCKHTLLDHFHWDEATGWLSMEDRSCTICDCGNFKDSD